MMRRNNKKKRPTMMTAITTTSTTTTATTNAVKFAATDIREKNKKKESVTEPGPTSKIKGGTLPGTRRLGIAKEASMGMSLMKWTKAQHPVRPSRSLPEVTLPLKLQTRARIQQVVQMRRGGG